MLSTDKPTPPPLPANLDADNGKYNDVSSMSIIIVTLDHLVYKI